MALRAGMQMATVAPVITVNVAIENVIGSVALTPQSKLATNRARTTEAPSPITTPIRTSPMPHLLKESLSLLEVSVAEKVIL